MIALSVHNPEQVRVVDRVDERATLLLSRVEIKRSSHAGQIFAWLFAQCGGKAGTVREVSLSQIVAAVDCSASGVCKWLKLLAARGLIEVAERAKRLDPYVIHVLEAAPSVAQKTFDFMPEPVMTATVMRVVRQDDPETKFGNMNEAIDTARTAESRLPTVYTQGKYQRCTPTVNDGQAAKTTTKPPMTDRTEMVAGSVVSDSSGVTDDAGETRLARDVRHAGASNHQTNQSILNQSQTIQASKLDALSQEIDRRRAMIGLRPADSRAGPDPATIGAALGNVAAGMFARLASNEQRQADVARLKAEVFAAISEPTLSRQWVDHACEMAHSDQQSDGLRPFGPADVRRILRYAKPSPSPARAFHGAVRAELTKRGLPLPQKLTAKGGA
jgi:hypothetical protein